MHVLAFLFRRKTGMSLEDFHRQYEEVHGPLVARTMPGLVQYIHYPIRPAGRGDIHATISPGFDALSIYIFESAEAAEAAWNAPSNIAIQEDSGTFIDFASMITLPLARRVVVDRLPV